LLCDSILNTTRQPGPGSGSKNSVRDSLSFGSESNDLLKNSFPFFVHCTASLKHHGSKIVVRVFKGGPVPINLLRLSVRFTRFQSVEMGGGERTNDGNIDSEAAAEAPVLDGDIARSATSFISHTKDAQLFHLGSEEPSVSELEHEIP
jgi:hypothetical protein